MKPGLDKQSAIFINEAGPEHNCGWNEGPGKPGTQSHIDGTDGVLGKEVHGGFLVQSSPDLKNVLKSIF